MAWLIVVALVLFTTFGAHALAKDLVIELLQKGHEISADMVSIYILSFVTVYFFLFLVCGVITFLFSRVGSGHDGFLPREVIDRACGTFLVLTIGAVALLILAR